jgi:hypothetical protein
MDMTQKLDLHEASKVSTGHLLDSPQDNSSETITVYCYTPAGFKLGVAIQMDALIDAASLDSKMQALGYLPALPGLEPGQDKNVIATVVRRVHINKETGAETPIIDFYTEWDAGGKFGEFRYGHVYLNDAKDIAEFEAQSGLSFETLPVYDSQSPLQRIYNRPNANEVKVKRPFEFSKKEIGKHENGMTKYEYGYLHPMAVSMDNQQTNGNGASNGQSWANADTVDKMIGYAMAELGLAGRDAVSNALQGSVDDLEWLNHTYTRATALSALKAFAASRVVKS